MKTKYLNRVVGLRSVSYMEGETPKTVWLKRGQSVELESTNVKTVDDGIQSTAVKSTTKKTGGDE